MTVKRFMAHVALLVASLIIVGVLMTQVHASQCRHGQIRRIHLHRCVGIYSSLAAPYVYRWAPEHHHRHHPIQRDELPSKPESYFVDVSIPVKETPPEPEAPRKAPPRFSTSPWNWPVE